MFDEVEKRFLASVLANRFDEVQSFVDSQVLNGDTIDDAFVLAAWRGRLPLVKLLLDAGADIEAKGYRLNTALQCATGERKTEVVRFLLSSGAEDKDRRAHDLLNGSDTDKDLHLGVKTRNKDRVRSAVLAGARLDSVDQNRRTCIETAARRGSFGIVELLLSIETDDNRFSNASLAKALSLLEGSPNSQHNEAISSLLHARLKNVSVLPARKRFNLYGQNEPDESRLKRDEIIYGLIRATRY